MNIIKKSLGIVCPFLFTYLMLVTLKNILLGIYFHLISENYVYPEYYPVMMSIFVVGSVIIVFLWKIYKKL